MKKVNRTDLLELEDLIFEKHIETRSWVQNHTDRLDGIQLQLDALCHYLGIKMEYKDEQYYKITSLGEEDK